MKQLPVFTGLLPKESFSFTRAIIFHISLAKEPALSAFL
jgi:hypothetical protein